MKKYVINLFLLFIVSCSCVSASPSRIGRELAFAALTKCKQYVNVEIMQKVASDASKMAVNIQQGAVQRYNQYVAQSLKQEAPAIQTESIKNAGNVLQDVQVQSTTQPIAQGAKTDAVIHTSSWIGGGTTIYTTNHYHTINNYGKKSFSEVFAEWIKNGAQKRAFCFGLGVGSGVTYVVVKQQKEIVYLPVATLPTK